MNTSQGKENPAATKKLFSFERNILTDSSQHNTPRLEGGLSKGKHIINRQDVATIYGADDITRVNSQTIGSGADPCLKNNNA